MSNVFNPARSSNQFWDNTRNPIFDAYGRLRISDPYPIFDCQTQYDSQPFLMDDILVGAATTTFLPNESTVQLNVGTASGDKVTRRSRQWIRYQPSKSQQVTMTGLLGAPKTNVSQRVGYFDDNNGLFFEQTSNGMFLVRRTTTSGTVVNNRIPQSSWNLNTLDGQSNSNNPCGLKLNTSEIGIFLIDFQWLGASRVRWGFSFGNHIVYVHEFEAANILSVAYMTTGNLPVTYEIENTGISASSTSMKALCCAVNSEGGTDKTGFTFSNGNNGNTPVTTRVPLFSIRPKLLFNGITNRGQVIPLGFSVINTVGGVSGVYLEIVRGCALTGASFVSQSTSSITEYDISATTISGGEIIGGAFIAASADGTLPIDSKIPLTLNALGTVGDILAVVATSVNSTPKVSVGLSWKELR